MKQYKSEKDIGVIAYDIVDDGIIIMFNGGESYLYNEQKPGKKHLTALMQLAKAGKGLSTYINQHVRGNYFKKL